MFQDWGKFVLILESCSEQGHAMDIWVCVLGCEIWSQNRITMNQSIGQLSCFLLFAYIYVLWCKTWVLQTIVHVQLGTKLNPKFGLARGTFEPFLSIARSQNLVCRTTEPNQNILSHSQQRLTFRVVGDVWAISQLLMTRF